MMRLFVLLSAVLFVCIGCFSDSIQSDRNEELSFNRTISQRIVSPLPRNINELSNHEFIRVVLAPLKSNNNFKSKSMALSAGFGFSNLNLAKRENLFLAEANQMQAQKLTDMDLNNKVKQTKIARTVIPHLSSYAFTN